MPLPHYAVTLALLLWALPALGGPVASPQDTWANKVCPKESPGSQERAQCLKKALTETLLRRDAELKKEEEETRARIQTEAPSLAQRLRTALAELPMVPASEKATKEAEVAKLRASMDALQLPAAKARYLPERWETLQGEWKGWTEDGCALADLGRRKDFLTGGDLDKPVGEAFTRGGCEGEMHAWRGALGEAVARRDAQAVAAVISALEAGPRQEVAPSAALVDTTMTVAARALARASKLAPDESGSGRMGPGDWNGLLRILSRTLPRPQRIAWLECQLLREQGGQVPSRCEDRLKAALERGLGAFPARLAKAALEPAPPDALVQPWVSRIKRPEAEPDLPRQSWDDTRSEDPVLQKRVEPVYTAEARAARAQGFFLAECGVIEDGSVSFCRTIFGVPPMDSAILTALKQWRYTWPQGREPGRWMARIGLKVQPPSE